MKGKQTHSNLKEENESKDTSHKTQDGIPKSKKTKSLNYKRKILFTYASFERRNTDKALVRSLPKTMKGLEKEILEEYKTHNIAKHRYKKVVQTFDQLSILEKRSTYKKDYAMIINYMMYNISERIISSCRRNPPNLTMRTRRLRWMTF